MPQPIDMQTELGRAAMVERVQEAMTRVSLAAQQRARSTEEEDQILAESTVDETAETQGERVDADTRGNNPRAKGRPSAGREQPPEDETGGRPSRRQTQALDPETHGFDVSV